MKNLKKSLAILLVALTVCLISNGFVFAKVNGISEFYVIAVDDAEQTKINWKRGSIDDKHYLYLPSDCDISALKVFFKADSKVTVNGKELKSGENTDIFKNTGEYEVACGENIYKLTVLKSANIPSVYIDTQSGNLDKIHSNKNYKEEANICVVEGGKVTLTADLEYIKGRGNATWDYTKKPYNIKFYEKTDFFKMGAAKKWALLANHVDESLIRNQTAFSLAEKIGLLYTSSCKHIDLYINNEYQGSYLVCESVEVGDTRIDITDLDKLNEKANPNIKLDECTKKGPRSGSEKGSRKWVELPNEPADISGGYLLEFELSDRYPNEVSGFITNQGQPIVVKCPEYASENQLNYIADLYQELEDAVYSNNGYNSLGKHYSEYLDMESFIKMYLLQEYFENLDASITSFFIIKDAKSDKFIASPIWDYDQALGEPFARYGLNTKDPDHWWASIIYYEYGPAGRLPTFFRKLCEKEYFTREASNYWREKFSPALTDGWFGEIEKNYTNLKASALMNAIRCNTYKNSEIEKNKTRYIEDCESMVQFLKDRKAFLDKGFSENAARIYYKNNGGSGIMFSEDATLVGDTIKLKHCTFRNNSYKFLGWNTKYDGSGTAYEDEAEITVDSARLELYAQWEGFTPTVPAETDELKSLEGGSFWSSIGDFFKGIWEWIAGLFS